MRFSKDNILLVFLTFLEMFILTLMKSNTHTILIMILYAILGYGLRIFIKRKGLVEGNATFDIMGILGSTVIAIYYLGEKLTTSTIIGIVLGLGSLYFLN